MPGEKERKPRIKPTPILHKALLNKKLHCERVWAVLPTPGSGTMLSVREAERAWTARFGPKVEVQVQELTNEEKVRRLEEELGMDLDADGDFEDVDIDMDEESIIEDLAAIEREVEEELEREERERMERMEEGEETDSDSDGEGEDDWERLEF